MKQKYKKMSLDTTKNNDIFDWSSYIATAERTVICELTDYDPGVSLYGNILVFEGSLTFENSPDFFENLILLYEKSMEEFGNGVIISYIDYFNSSNLIYFEHFIYKIARKFGADNLCIYWYYKEGDDDSMEEGLDVQKSYYENFRLTKDDTSVVFDVLSYDKIDIEKD